MITALAMNPHHCSSPTPPPPSSMRSSLSPQSEGECDTNGPTKSLASSPSFLTRLDLGSTATRWIGLREANRSECEGSERHGLPDPLRGLAPATWTSPSNLPASHPLPSNSRASKVFFGRSLRYFPVPTQSTRRARHLGREDGGAKVTMAGSTPSHSCFNQMRAFSNSSKQSLYVSEMSTPSRADSA